MEIINLETRAYDMMMSRFKEFTTRVEQMCKTNREHRLEDWLDNQDLSLALNVSKRTLQTLRDSGKLPFTKINHKVYYRCSDVELFINKKGSSDKVRGFPPSSSRLQLT